MIVRIIKTLLVTYDNEHKICHNILNITKTKEKFALY